MEFDKSKIFTAVNADEIEIGSIGCFANDLQSLSERVTEGLVHKVTEIKPITSERRFVSDFNSRCVSDCSLFYLVEEPTKYRPYENTDEMIEDFKKRAKKHYNANFFKCPMFYPFIWLKSKENGDKPLCTYFGVSNVLVGMKYFSLETLFKKYTYLDGSPCGKEIK